jgi:hypothetical protein
MNHKFDCCLLLLLLSCASTLSPAQSVLTSSTRMAWPHAALPSETNNAEANGRWYFGLTGGVLFTRISSPVQEPGGAFGLVEPDDGTFWFGFLTKAEMDQEYALRFDVLYARTSELVGTKAGGACGIWVFNNSNGNLNCVSLNEDAYLRLSSYICRRVEGTSVQVKSARATQKGLLYEAS